MWRTHAESILANVSLERFDCEHVEHLFDSLRKSGASPAVINKVAVVLQRAISVAIRRRLYHRANPLSLVEKPRHRAKETKAMTVPEARRFVKAAQGDEFEALWLLMLTTGLRFGEAIGLEWRDIDLKNGTLAVRQSVVEVDGVARVAEPKTASSRRRVELGALAVDSLRRHQAKMRPESRFVFETGGGGHPRRSNLRQRSFQPICVQAKIVGLTPHGLRHSMASIGMAQGIPAKVLAERLGHSTTRMTMDRYQHVAPSLQKEASRTLDGLLRGPSRKAKSEK
jgi:integrase